MYRVYRERNVVDGTCLKGIVSVGINKKETDELICYTLREHILNALLKKAIESRLETDSNVLIRVTEEILKKDLEMFNAVDAENINEAFLKMKNEIKGENK